MRFRTRLTLTHSALIIVIILILAVFFWRYNINSLEETAYQDLRVLSKNLSNQLDEVVKPMQFISDFLLSDGNTLASIKAMSNIGRYGAGEKYVLQAKRDVRIALTTYCINENFYRVNIFSRGGDFLTSNIRPTSIPDGSAVPAQMPGIRDVDEVAGGVVLIPPHIDTWALNDAETVFSLARAVLGGTNRCYIEVQKLYGDLKDIYELEDGNNRVAVISDKGELFYSQLTGEQNNFLLENFEHNLTDWPGAMYGFDGSIAAVEYSPYTKTYTIAVRGKDIMERNAAKINGMIFLAFAVIGIISILFVFASSVRLASPIRRLTAQMERTTLGNMDDGIQFERSNDEIESLNNTYSHLLKRLNQAHIREKQLGQMQLQAEFDALQSQVNPHFIYNVLNVISNRGALREDEVICEICKDLAAMLRYSTGTSKRFATVGEELEYVRHYFLLLKARYREELHFSIDVDPKIEKQQIPKIVLQQIVENSIEHGLRDISGVMRIEISGWIENGYWLIRIEDNGSGFDSRALTELREKTQKIRKRSHGDHWRMEMDIGGMGLINAFSRMLLLFGDAFIFDFSNRKECEKGAIVTIGAIMNPEKTE